MDIEPPILYTQAGCADSARVRALLGARGVRFLERNVTASAEAARDLAATGIFATPLLIAGQRHVFGFRPGQMAKILGIDESKG